MLDYSVTLTPDDDGSRLVTCAQLPEVTTFGESEAAALRHAVSAIEEALARRIEEGADIPRSKRGRGTPVRLPLLTTLKVQLYWALQTAGITRAELARRLDWNRESVDRLFRLDHRSRLEQLEAAFKALGEVVEVVVKKVA